MNMVLNLRVPYDMELVSYLLLFCNLYKFTFPTLYIYNYIELCAEI